LSVPKDEHVPPDSTLVKNVVQYIRNKKHKHRKTYLLSDGKEIGAEEETV